MLVGTVGGGNYELDARSMLTKRLSVRGTVLRARSLDEKIHCTRLFHRKWRRFFVRACSAQPLIARLSWQRSQRRMNAWSQTKTWAK